MRASCFSMSRRSASTRSRASGCGSTCAGCAASEEATAADIMTAYPDLAIRKGAEIILKSNGDAFAEAFLARYGGRIRKFVVEAPSLESVFLSLTGRDLRDQAAGAREL